MAARKWEWQSFGNPAKYILIDNRWRGVDGAPLKVTSRQNDKDVIDIENVGTKEVWPAYLIIPINGRTTAAEAKEVARMLCARLDAMEVEKFLGGDGK